MTVRLRAPAKLTLRLAVTGVRDDGYHLIDAEMVALDLCDDIEIDPDGDWIRLDGPFAAGIATDGSNLVSRALALAGRTAGVTVTKNIPHGGGLGGGSADAAAVLRWAGITDPRRTVTVGADVAFCASGLARARVTGIGEIIDALPPLDLAVTLVIPPLSVSTRRVYEAWDEMTRGRGAEAANADDGAVNDLEAAACAVEPSLAHWRDRIAEVAGSPQLAGSGATWFVLGHHEELGRALPDATVVLTRSVSA